MTCVGSEADVSLLVTAVLTAYITPVKGPCASWNCSLLSRPSFTVAQSTGEHFNSEAISTQYYAIYTSEISISHGNAALYSQELL